MGSDPLAESSIIPLELRLRALEAQVLGVGSSLSDRVEPPHDGRAVSVNLRVGEIHDKLEAASSSSDALKRLINGYQQYLPLLTLSHEPTPTSQKDSSGQGTAEDETAITPSDLLSDEVKLAMVLEAAGDIRTAERDLRDIELLRSRGVEGAGTLEEVISLKSNLASGIRAAQSRGRDLGAARKQVGELLMRYNDYTSTMSDLFLDVHRRLEVMEETVARAERARRKELAERY
ncbi:hypothetical protein EHS25_009771 [Saitozyma podzolica]|uniref:Uncharacterized protein n=1 Tax=Saitozyma podzolica TaxID=1890683 RepID=A0A427YK51_9TREE|nr:hypothetical protein EHS25_009771 [Saitozyma podzolica]